MQFGEIQENCARKSDVRRENETLSVYCSWERALFEVFDVLFQNPQGSLVSKNNNKKSLVMQSDKKRKDCELRRFTVD